jgi:hypothetical protein
MSESITFNLLDRKQAWSTIQGRLFPFLAKAFDGGRRWVLTIRLETRTMAQNRLMWPLLTAFSRQLQWPINGKLVNMDSEDWKDVLTAAFKGETVKIAMGLDGGVVMLGQRTSRFTKPQFSEWIEFLYATASDRNVRLPAWVDEDTGEVLYGKN